MDPIDEVSKRFFESQRVGEQVINTKKPVTISDGSLASTRCEDCRKSDFTMNRAEGTIVCTNCGLVKESRVIDETSEWRNFSNENGDGAGNTRNRVGGKLNPYMSDFGLSTMVKGSGATNVQQWAERTQMNSADKMIQKGHSRIKEISSCLGLKSATVDKAFELYKQIADNGKLRGRSIDARVATCIFMASRLVDQPKPIKKILVYTDCTEKDLSRCYKKVKDLFPMYQTRLFASKVAEQACNRFELPIDIVQACKTTSDNLSSLQVTEGKKPQTIAGAAIYMVLQESRAIKTKEITIEDIANVVEIKPATILDTCR